MKSEHHLGQMRAKGLDHELNTDNLVVVKDTQMWLVQIIYLAAFTRVNAVMKTRRHIAAHFTQQHHAVEFYGAEITVKHVKRKQTHKDIGKQHGQKTPRLLVTLHLEALFSDGGRFELACLGAARGPAVAVSILQPCGISGRGDEEGERPELM